MLLTAASSAEVWSWSYSVSVAASGDHPTFLILVIESWRRKASRAWGSREVIRCNGRRDRWRISPFYVGIAYIPPSGTETWIFEYGRVDRNETFPNAVLDVRQVGSTQLPYKETVRLMVKADLLNSSKLT